MLAAAPSDQILFLMLPAVAARTGRFPNHLDFRSDGSDVIAMIVVHLIAFISLPRETQQNVLP